MERFVAPKNCLFRRFKCFKTTHFALNLLPKCETTKNRQSYVAQSSHRLSLFRYVLSPK